MRPPEYLDLVRNELGDLPPREREAALSDLADALADQTPPGLGEGANWRVPSGFGSPHEYAAQVRAALTRDDAAPRPAGQVLGVPLDLRGPVDAAVRSRVWDPANPAVFVPRLFGAGWTVNLGAVAVRLGLLRPDDVDEDVVDHVPAMAVRLASLTPSVLAAATAAAVAARWSRLPSRVPVSWSASGSPRRWAGRGSVVGLAAVGAAPAAWVWLPTSRKDRLIRASLATWMAGAAAASVAAAVADTEAVPGDRGHGQFIPVGLAASGTAAFLVLYLPIRAGLRAVWRERNQSGSEERA